MKAFKIVGLGPGHEDYILPVAKKMISEADHLIGGRRHLDATASSHQRQTELKGNYSDVVAMLKANEKESIVVVVSGDTGFYSMAKYLGRFFDKDQYQCIPGISSIQYMFAKINGSWDHAYLGSVHGRELDLEKLIDEYSWIGLLTDQVMTPERIARRLSALGTFKMYIGENLSYEDEKIHEYHCHEMVNKSFGSLNVVIVEKIEA